MFIPHGPVGSTMERPLADRRPIGPISEMGSGPHQDLLFIVSGFSGSSTVIPAVLEARTDVIQNISTYKRSPGTYDSMHRYILVLEDADLVDRYKNVKVPKDEYDMPVPQRFRRRTFVRITDDGSYSDNKDAWDNPYGAVYDDSGSPVEPEEEEPLSEFEDIEIDDGTPDDDEGEDDTGDSGGRDLGGFTEDVELSAPASFTDFPNKSDLLDHIRSKFNTALEQTLDQSPGPQDVVEFNDFGFGTAAIVGQWAEGNATPGSTDLTLIISIDNTDAELSPTFITTGMPRVLERELSQDNPYPDTFPGYRVFTPYNSEFLSTVRTFVDQEQSEDIYYDLIGLSLEDL